MGSQLPLSKTPTVKPVLKWAGGKQQLLEVLLKNSPTKYNKYIEPFIGGGALFFALQPDKAIIADSNSELIHLYNAIRTNVEEIISFLKTLPNEEKFYYDFRKTDTSKLSVIEQAARTIYLNRTCYNGLYRVNKKGGFNVPFGYYKKPNICDEQNLRAVSIFLKDTQIVHGDYKDVLIKYAEPGDFIFLDPPYLPASKYADFKRYTKEQFYEEDHHELAAEVERLHELGCHILLTNSDHGLVYNLYEPLGRITSYATKRLINSDASKRTGVDLLVKVEPKQQLIAVPDRIILPRQMEQYPSTRYMGSKQNLLDHIWSVASQFKFDSVLDLFSGSGAVSYLFKTQNKRVFSNDYMAFSANFTKALVENSDITLNENDIKTLLNPSVKTDDYVSITFKDLYFVDEDNAFIDLIRANVKKLKNAHKRALALNALVRACLKKRPRGIFTYTGYRYDDGRRDLTLTFQEQFLEAIVQINNAVFDNGMQNKSRHGDAMNCKYRADLVYIDPPYFSPLSDNEYVRRYHFVEGLVRDWKGVEMQWHTKTKKFKSYPTPFSSLNGAKDAFDLLFRKHKDSILIVSYSSNSLPTKDEMVSIMSKHKSKVEVISFDHRYSFGNQGSKIEDNNNQVKEYLFVGY